MATIFRPPLTLKVEPKDPRFVALRSQRDVDPGNDLVLEQKGQDRQFAGPGQWKTYDYPNPGVPRRSISLWSHTYLALALTLTTVVQAPFPATETPPNPRAKQPLAVGFVAGTPNTLTAPVTAVTDLGAASETGGPTFTRVSQYQASYGTPICLTVVTQAPFNQDEWRIPRAPRRPVKTYDDTQWSFTLPLQAGVAAPFAQEDWPNPRGARRNNPDWVASTPQPILGSIQPLTETNYDWPNPRGAKPVVADWIYGTPYSLASAVAPPFFETEWPNPRGAKPKVSDWQDSFKLPLQTIKPANQYDWPNPLPPRRSQQLGWLNPGLGLTTTVVYPATITFDWPNPRLPVATPRGFTDSFKLSLTTVKGTAQYDWPNPRGAKPVVADWQAGLPLNTLAVIPTPVVFTPAGSELGQPTFTRTTLYQTAWRPSVLLGIPAQPYPIGNQHDWPNPQQPRRIPALGHIDHFRDLTATPEADIRRPVGDLKVIQRSLSVSTTGPNLVIRSVVTYPATIRFDWPNPRGAKPGQDWVKGTPQTLLGSLKPFTQGDWPVPKGARRSGDLGWTVGSTNIATPLFPAVVQLNWQPRAPQPLNRGFTDSFKLPLQTLVPANQYTWPNPRGAKPVVADWIFGTAVSLSTAVAPPFFETEWPNPRGAKPVVASWQDSFKLPLQTLRPANQYDWPVPKGAKGVAGFVNQPLTFQVTVSPFSQSDWPVPKGRQGKVSDWQQSFSLSFTARGTAQYDWPVPKGAKPNQPLSWTDSFKLPLTTVRPPYQEKHWPVPKGAKPKVADWVAFKSLAAEPEAGPADEPERIVCVPSAEREAVVPETLRLVYAPEASRTATVGELSRVAYVPEASRIVDSNKYRDESCHGI